MKPPKPELTLAQVKAIRDIEQQLAELERKRRCLAREMGADEAPERTGRRSAKAER